MPIGTNFIFILPAYLVAVLIGIVMPLLTGRAVVPMPAIISHLFFTNSILELDWISPVFWTLAIEFQFYILGGLLFKYVSQSNNKSLILIITVAILSLFLKNVSFIFHWFPFFSLGILIYNRKFTNMTQYIFWPMSALMLVMVTFVFGLPEIIAASFAFLFIFFIKMENKTVLNKVLLWLGAISYSLYLVHWEIGRTAVGLTCHIPTLGHYELFKVFVGLIISIFSAWLLYRFVEKPSIKYSGKVKYITSDTKPEILGQV